MNDKIDPRVKRSRRALLDTAVDLLLVTPMANMSEIAQAAGVGRATLYRHFESREALVRELTLESLYQTDEVLKPIKELDLDARETLSRGLKAVMKVANRFHFLLLLWHISGQDAKVLKIYQRQLDQISDLIEQGKKEKSINLSLPTPWVINLIDSLVYAGWWSIHSGEMNAEEAGDYAVRTLFGGIAA